MKERRWGIEGAGVFLWGIVGGLIDALWIAAMIGAAIWLG